MTMRATHGCPRNPALTLCSFIHSFMNHGMREQQQMLCSASLLIFSLHCTGHHCCFPETDAVTSLGRFLRSHAPKPHLEV
jgi:hypothetical protein